MKRIFSIAVVFVGVVLSGCNDEKVKTVDWWEENKQARLDKLEECLGTDDDAVRKSPNCVNAIEARRKINLVGEKDEDYTKTPSIE
ncbi:MAG: EexN family lipoprotein [Pseudomonadota bacterium]